MSNTAGAAQVRWRLLTPGGVPGAVAVIGLEARSESAIDGAVERLGLAPVPVGSVELRPLSPHDRGVVARWSERCVHLMPHGGIAVVREVTGRLGAAGIPHGDTAQPPATYPEARDRVEALMLHALAQAESPLAIDLLLDQPRRWRSARPGQHAAPASLNRLIRPPLVVTLGASNIGKSTLMNALAGRAVSIVADEPGTTRDHVGAALNLGGLVVRYADTPGLRTTEDPAEREALELSQRLAQEADLLILMGDTTHALPQHAAASQATTVSVALRTDLGVPAWRHDVAVCSLSGQGLTELVSCLRERLVPGAALADPRPWRFWEALGMEYRPGES